MKKGLILINAYLKSENGTKQANRLKEEFLKLNVNIDIKRNNEFALSIDKNGNIINKFDYDFVIYLDKDKYVSKMLEKANVRIFNSHQAIEDCDDKMTTQIILANNGIKMPKTLPGLLCYNNNESLNEEALHIVEKELSYPLIIKTSFGSLGKGVFKIDNYEMLYNKANELKCVPNLFQEYLETSYGKDIRAFVIGKKFVTAMVRNSNNDFRSNIELGGHGEVYKPSLEFIKMCEKIALILNLDYCGIDILFGQNDYFVSEVNSNAYFNELEKVTGVNIAKIYATYIYENIYNKP